MMHSPQMQLPSMTASKGCPSGLGPVIFVMPFQLAIATIPMVLAAWIGRIVLSAVGDFRPTNFRNSHFKLTRVLIMAP